MGGKIVPSGDGGFTIRGVENPRLTPAILTALVAHRSELDSFFGSTPRAIGLARFARALHTAIKKGRGAHTFSCGRRCPAGADEGMRCAPWPANCPHPAVPARPRKRGSPRSP